MNARSTGHRQLSETLFRLFVESVVDYAIFMLDAEGYVISWNPGAQRAKGYTESEIVGQHFSIFYTPEDKQRDHPAHELDIARATGRYEEEGWRVRKDGTRFWANVVITAIKNEAGEVLGFGKVTRDLTARKAAEEREHELRREQVARAEAEAANQAKSEFLTRMSHELRTPLNAIIGYADLLQMGVQGALTAPQKGSLDRVKHSSKHLLSLINDVLNVARSSTGKVDYHIRAVKAGDLLAEVEPLVAPQFMAHNISFHWTPCPEDVFVSCDADKTQQILLNLLTNAYKYTPEGGSVELGCRIDNDSAHFEVVDDGRGIPAEKLNVIFEPFVQIDRHLNRESQQGIGLGLSISRDLARAMKGELRVASEVGHGSRFTLTLPRVRR